MKKTIQLFVCGILFFATIASAQDRVRGNGKIATEKRNTSAYQDIKVTGSFDIDLVSGNEGSITIQGEENLLSFVKIEVEDNVLKVATEKGKNISPSLGKKIQITIPFESISSVTLAGSGEIKTKNTIKASDFNANLSGSGDLSLAVETSKFEVNLSGSGDIVLTGTTTDFTSKLSGSGDIDASGLKAKNANVTVSGSGDSKVFCSESLYARVSGSGDIDYKGDPIKMDTKVNGSGEISKD